MPGYCPSGIPDVLIFPGILPAVDGYICFGHPAVKGYFTYHGMIRVVNDFGLLLKKSFGSEGIPFSIDFSIGRCGEGPVSQFACLLIQGINPVRV